MEPTLEALVFNRTGIVNREAEGAEPLWYGHAPLGNVRGAESRTRQVATEALRQIAQKVGDISGMRIISATTSSGIDVTERFYRREDGVSFEPTALRAQKAGDHVAQFAQRAIVSTACSSSANSIMMGAREIAAGLRDEVIVGGVEGYNNYTIKGFRSLGIYSSNICRPFSADRDGLNLGEGACYMVLSSSPEGALAKVSGWCNAVDGYHATALSEEATGPRLAMAGALERAGLQPQDIDYVNCHGTATPNNDAVEQKALESIFTERMPLYASTKHLTGHTLGAAGAIEAAISVMALQQQRAFGCKGATKAEIKNVLTNSFGFGGNCTALIISKV